MGSELVEKSDDLPRSKYQLERESENRTLFERLHQGKGTVDIRFFFKQRSARPALLMTYTIPPGASEGVHTHQSGDVKEGSFDEFYYILSGSGEMDIAGEKVAVKPGDHVFVPNGIAHGIENSSDRELLKVFLVAVQRD